MVAAEKLIYRYWGKATKSQGDLSPECHLLAYHCLDVSSVAAYWWDNDPCLRSLFYGHCPEPIYRAWILFFISLHDLGKWDIRFQAKCWTAWQSLNSDETAAGLEKYKWDHGQGGLYWLKRDYAGADSSQEDIFASNHPKQSWLPWMAAVAGHHGYVMQPEYVDGGEIDERAIPLRIKKRANIDKQARKEFISQLETLFLTPAGLSLNDNPPELSPLLAGFCSVCDWLGSWSTETTFHYQSVAEPLNAYFSRRYSEDAPAVIQRSGLISRVRNWGGVEALLKEGFSPRQLQTLVEGLPAEPGLTIVEAPTGSGKTETALAYAWRLLAEGHADSIIFALPTQATANAMLARLEKLAAKIFDNPNLILAHGQSRYNSEFSAIKLRGESVQEEEAWVQCCEWLSLSSKRAFLGQIGVCTIDQVLISVLPVKHRFIRGFGLGRSVLLVDEVHAYDTYMNNLLEEVLRQQCQAGQSALLLSATLPPELKRRLLKTYGGEASREIPDHYPLVIWQSEARWRSFDLSSMPQHLPPSFSLGIDRRYMSLMEPDQVLLDEIIAAALAGAQVCLICNLVDVAQRVYQQLSTVSSLNVQLFHSRFTFHDRAAIEKATLEHFGPDNDERSQGRILVATQVVEQSLDVDFDWLITQHCPVDLLFQRAGRLHRHVRQTRPKGFEAPRLTVLLPDTTDYGKSNYIYTNTLCLWRTQRLIEKLADEPLIFPHAYRAWINDAYREPGVGEDIPGWVSEGKDKFEEKEFTKRSAARLMLNDAQRATPFADTDVHVQAVTRDGEMSLPLVPYVDTSAGKQLLDGSLPDSLSEYSRPEVLALNRVNVPAGWASKYDLTPDDEGLVWIAGVRGDDGCWQAKTAKGCLTYSPNIGMTAVPL